MPNTVLDSKFYTTKITTATMSAELENAKRQQVETTQQYLSLKGLATKTGQESFLIPFTQKKVFRRNDKHTQIDNFDRKVVDVCQYIGRSNEDYIAAKRISINQKKLSSEQKGQALFDAIMELNKKIEEDDTIIDRTLGATLTICLVSKDEDGRKVIHTAQIGDSCALYISDQQTKRLAARHTIEYEMDRLKHEGTEFTDPKKGPLRILREEKFEGEVISRVSFENARNLGYKGYNIVGISNVPTISETVIDDAETNKKLIIMSDGAYYNTDDLLISQIVKHKIFDEEDQPEHRLNSIAAKICCLGHREVYQRAERLKVPSQEIIDKLDDSSAIVVDLDELSEGLFVISDGNSKKPANFSEEIKMQWEHLLAKMSCELLPVLLEEKINQAHLINCEAFQNPDFHEPSISQEPLEPLSQEVKNLSLSQEQNNNNQEIKSASQLEPLVLTYSSTQNSFLASYDTSSESQTKRMKFETISNEPQPPSDENSEMHSNYYNTEDECGQTKELTDSDLLFLQQSKVSAENSLKTLKRKALPNSSFFNKKPKVEDDIKSDEEIIRSDNEDDNQSDQYAQNDGRESFFNFKKMPTKKGSDNETHINQCGQ